VSSWKDCLGSERGLFGVSIHQRWAHSERFIVVCWDFAVVCQFIRVLKCWKSVFDCWLIVASINCVWSQNALFFKLLSQKFYMSHRPYIIYKSSGGVYGVFLSVGDYFFAMYSFRVVRKGVGTTRKGTSKNKCPGYKC